jgi:hypothetical protein
MVTADALSCLNCLVCYQITCLSGIAETRMRSGAALGALAVALAATGLAACSGSAGPATAGPAARVVMTQCGEPPQPRPDVVQVICQTNDIIARHLAWAGWATAVATGSGVAVVDLCAFSDCHNSDYTSAPIVVIASRLRACPDGTRAYSRLQYVFVGASPFQGLPAHVSFRNFMDAPGRPHPPRNQTVSLTC